MTAESAAAAAGSGLRVLALLRSGWGRGLPEGWRLVEAGPVAAAVRAAGDGAGGWRTHARRVESLVREVPLVPVPPGVRARDRQAVRTFLERARLPLLEALDLCEGCWELRVHLSSGSARGGHAGEGVGSAPGAGVGETAGAARELHRALRRRSRAVRRLPSGDRGRRSCAYLVARPRWIGFVEEAARREGAVPGLAVDVTGPWAPWDFVRVFAEEES